MNGIKKLNIYPKLTAILLGGTMAFSLTGCGGHVDMQSMTTSEVLQMQEVQDVTLMDELIANGKLRYGEELDIVQAADQLERYMNIVDHLDSIKFDDVSELESLSPERYQETLSYTMDDIDLLIEMASYKGKNLKKQEEKLTALKQLYYLYNYCNEWISSNGQNISINIMMAAIKGAVADELNISVDNYSSITIPASNGSNEPDSNFIKVGDKQYEVKTSAQELWNTINYIYAVQNYDPENGNEFETYRKAINYAKTTMAAGANVKNNRLEEQYNASYIEKNYVK